MSTPVLPDERAEQTLRAWLGAGDPQPAGAYAVPEHVRDRVLDAVSAESTAPASEAAKSGRWEMASMVQRIRVLGRVPLTAYILI